MNAYLLRHAIDNIWCNPGQDNQFVYQLARLTRRYGRRHQMQIFYENLVLPLPYVDFHVYQIGKILPQRLGLTNQAGKWLCLDQVIENERLVAQLYVENGIEFPRHRCWIRLTPSRNLILAVEINNRIHDLEDSELYLRLYSNAYYESSRSSTDRQVLCRGKTIESEDDLLGFQRDYQRLLAPFDGHTLHSVNGRAVNRISLATAGVGDVVEWLFDASIKKVVDLPVRDLKSFRSTLDKRRKFLVRPQPEGTQTIDYVDDVDVYLLRPTRSDRFLGVYYHHNQVDWLRMLTHCDYALPVDRLQSFVRLHTANPQYWDNPDRWPEDVWTDINDLHLRFVIRDAGYQRPLVPNANRVDLLYALPTKQISRAMLGVDSTVSLWRAEALEACAYTRFMSIRPEDIYPITYGDPTKTSEGKEAGQALTGDVYGYHAAAQIMADTPSVVYQQNRRLMADLAYEHYTNATCFEYDQAGQLLGWYYHVKGSIYLPRHRDCVRVETLAGRGGDRLATTYGNNAVTIPQGYNYRLYIRPYRRQRPIGEWTDITEADDLSAYGYLDTVSVPHRWVWTLDDDTQYGAVRTDNRFLCYEFKLPLTDGYLRFSITSRETHDDRTEQRVLDLPFGQLDLLVNGRTLTENIDYFVHWPQVVITNREYLRQNDVQDILVRGYGFCEPDFTRLPITETGFVEYGVLSRDPRYDIFSNKVLRIVVDGHYVHRRDIVWDEQRNALTIDVGRNGAPYHIMTPPVVFRDVYDNDRQARIEDDARDREVSDYLTEFWGPFKREPLDVIPEPYPIVSPFANKLLHDLDTGILDPEGMYQHYDDHELKSWLKSYEWLLAYDPANMDVDREHLRVYPHWHSHVVDINLWQYQLLERACAVYQRYPVDWSGFVRVGDYYDFETTPVDLSGMTGRWDTSAVAVNDRLIIFGGQTPDGISNTTLAYNTYTSTFSQLAVTNPPSPRRFAQMAESRGSAYLTGGQLLNGQIDTHLYRLRGNQNWEVVGQFPEADQVAMCPDNDDLLVLVYHTPSGRAQTLRYSTLTRQNTVLAGETDHPAVRAPKLAVIGRFVYLTGYLAGSDEMAFWALPLEGGTWQRVGVTGSKRMPARDHYNHYTVNGKLYLQGGYHPTREEWLTDYWMIDPDDRQWMPLTPLDNRLSGETLARLGPHVYRFGGR